MSETFNLTVGGKVVRVAFYYGERRPVGAWDQNPYGALLTDQLERLGIEVEFVERWDAGYLLENQGRIDVLHHHWPHYTYYNEDPVIMERQMREFVRCLDLARELGYRVVWTAHNLYPHNRRNHEINHQFRLELCRIATAIIAHCDVAAEQIRATFGRDHNMFVIPHGHFIGVYPDNVTREPARQQLGVPPGDFAYGFFGGMQPYKGVEDLIDTFKRLPENSWLLIAGGIQPDYLATVQQHVGGHPRIVLRAYPGSRAPNEDIPLIMYGADVVTLPFLETTTSGSLILALSFGAPVIAPALGCLPMTVPPDAGILYDPRDPEGLLHAMTTIRDWDIPAASRAGLESARRFGWEQIARDTLRAYHA